jgi:hypothetical protein
MLRNLAPTELATFFEQLLALESFFVDWTDEVPKLLVINPAIIGALAKVEGFYQRPELRAEVTMHAPVVRYIKLKYSIVTIQEDYDEIFLHFE